MDEKTVQAFRDRIGARLAEVQQEDALGAQGREVVTLDQQAIGRLSRQDALQQQAMANATQARRDTERRRLAAALARMKDGAFGDCEECGEEIAERRLALDPGVTRCISCASG